MNAAYLADNLFSRRHWTEPPDPRRERPALAATSNRAEFVNGSSGTGNTTQPTATQELCAACEAHTAALASAFGDPDVLADRRAIAAEGAA
jgi:hypothetical protein